MLPSNHTIKTLFESRYSNGSHLHYLFLENITSKQWLNIKSSIVDTNNHLNGIFPSFNSFNSEFSPEFRLIDLFSSCFSFYQANCKDKDCKTTHLCKLDDIFKDASLNTNLIIVISDTSIRNNVATSIAHIYSYSNIVKKTLHYAVDVTLTEAELFAIRYRINQAIQVLNIFYIVVITDAIHAALHIFDSTIYPCQ